MGRAFTEPGAELKPVFVGGDPAVSLSSGNSLSTMHESTPPVISHDGDTDDADEDRDNDGEPDAS